MDTCRRLLGRRQRILLLQKHEHQHVCISPLIPAKAHRSNGVGPNGCLWVVLQEWNPELREPQSFIMGMPALCSRGIYYLSSTVDHYTNILEKIVQTEGQSLPHL